MKLNDYLRGVEACPEEQVEMDSCGSKRKVHRLTYDFGIYDNWPILLRADIATVLDDLQKRDWEMGAKVAQPEYGLTIQMLCYRPGTVIMQAMNELAGNQTSRGDSEEHWKRQTANFTMCLMIHPYRENKKIPGMSQERALARVIGEIGAYAQEKSTPLCFPQSRGWKNLGDWSRIVYYPDEGMVFE